MSAAIAGEAGRYAAPGSALDASGVAAGLGARRRLELSFADAAVGGGAVGAFCAPAAALAATSPAMNWRVLFISALSTETYRGV
jgi:hypothetical protein